MRFLILGAGGLGGYFGAILQRGGADVTFLVRPRRAAQLADRVLVVRTPTGAIEQRVKTVLAGEVDGHYDCVFLACKAYDLDSAIEAIAPALGDGSAILPVLNGINHIASLSERFGAAHVLGGLTTIAATMTPDGDVIRQAGTPDTMVFGELTGEGESRCEAIRDALVAGGIPGVMIAYGGAMALARLRPTLPPNYVLLRSVDVLQGVSLAPDWRDPLTGRTVRQLHARLTAPRPVPSCHALAPDRQLRWMGP